jgi:hypothetical protein
MQSHTPQAAGYSTVATPVTERQAQDGRVYPDLVAVGNPNTPAPNLLVQEPQNLDKYRAHEREMLTTYGWVDQNQGVVRIPIDRAKTLLIERGLPVRSGK